MTPLDNWYDYSHTMGMKIAISIPDNLFDAAEKVAQRLGISRSELYRRAVQRYLSDLSDHVIREKLDVVYGDDSSTLDPGIEYLQGASLPEDDW